MTWRGITRLLLAAGGLSAFCLGQNAPAAKPADAPCPTATKAASGQNAGQSSDQGSSQPTAKPCANAKEDHHTAAEQFPFPGDASQSEAPAANAPAPSAPKPSAASSHPFPGEPAADTSSSSSSSSSDDDGYDPNAPLPSTMRHPPPPRKVQTQDERVDEDLRVAKFYLDDGNLMGAYMRAKDAVRVEPDYSETHYVLGQVAQKMKKKDEAIAEYKAYLKMAPDGDRVKAVKRALAELQ